MAARPCSYHGRSPSGTGRAVTRFTDIWDKGKAAVIWSETTVTAPDGERGPSTSSAPPDRAPDVELSIPTLPQQALVYRLCGDRNPLHSDPAFASAAGFPKPILHGLCTYGIGCKALVDAFLDGDASRVGSYGARFAGVLYPGETLKASVWKDGGKPLAVPTAPARDDAVVLTGVQLNPF